MIVSYLSMFVENVAIETIRVGEALWPSAFSYADNPVLLRMKDSSLVRKGKESGEKMP